MRTEEEIKQALERRREARSAFEGGFDRDISPEGANDYLVAWVEKNVLGEHEEDNGYYCTLHRHFYYQPKSLGAHGLGCPSCHESQRPNDALSAGRGEK